MGRLITIITSMLLLVTIHAEAADFETATDAVKKMGLGWNLGNTLEAHSQSVVDVTDEHFWGQQDLSSESCWGQYPAKPELLKMMKEAGCDIIQGYYFSKPLPPEDFSKYAGNDKGDAK